MGQLVAGVALFDVGGVRTLNLGELRRNLRQQ